MNEDLRYKYVLRALSAPCWTSRPLEWTTMAGVGIAFYAREGRAGMFNLAWLMVNTDVPPSVPVYQQRKQGLAWLAMNAQTAQVSGMTLEFSAATKSLPEFCEHLRSSREVDYSLPLKCLLYNGLRKLEGAGHRVT